MERIVIAIVSVAVLLGTTTACTHHAKDRGEGKKVVEVFTWWTSGGERLGLDGLVSSFGTACADHEFVNGAVAGGGGSNAKAVLASRLQQHNPPDTFQTHAGAEISDYINNDQLEDLTADYPMWGLNTAFPKGLIDNLSINGKIYSVPANIHRANIVWTNKKVLSEAGITSDATTIERLIANLEILKDKGIATPLAIGKDWTQLMLLEVVLIANLGPDRFKGLWNGKTEWNNADVIRSINDYKKLLSYTNKDRDTLDWTEAEKLLVEGKAGYQLMGDWEGADLEEKNFKDYGYFTFPHTASIFQWLADSFVLPKGAKNVEGTKCWLKTVGSAEGQKAFNLKKGSIPARIDATVTDYAPYQQLAIADWKKATQVPSCAHGSACAIGLSDASNSAIGRFSRDLDVENLTKAFTAAIGQHVRN